MRALFQEEPIAINVSEDEYGHQRSPLGPSYPWQFVNGPLVGQPPTPPTLEERQDRMSDRDLPRFLFRCFTDKSGGATLRRFNKRLNMEDRIIPHYFLDHPNGAPLRSLAEYLQRNPDHMQKHLVGAMTSSHLSARGLPPLWPRIFLPGSPTMRPDESLLSTQL